MAIELHRLATVDSMILPLPLIANLCLSIISLVVLALGLYALFYAVRRAQRRRSVPLRESPSRVRNQPVRQAAPSLRPPTLWTRPDVTAPLAIGTLLVLFSFGGRHLVQLAYPVGDREPQELHSGRVQTVIGTGNAQLHVETFGKEGAPVLLFTHGWSLDNSEWFYAKRDLAPRYQLVFWDLPGLGQSTEPADRDFALEQLARNLHEVVTSVKAKSVILVGHSIGGMVNLTFCRLYPELLGTTVTGIVQVDTSYTNPVKTTKNPQLNLALQKPVAEPILHAMIALSPLVRVMNWLSYQNGSLSLMNAKSSFAGAETRGQLDLVSRLQAEASPAVVARGTLAMFHWDASGVLARIPVPVLVLVGREDTTTLPSANEHIASSVPRGALKEVAPAAHFSLLEQHQQIDEAILNFANAQFGTNVSRL